MNILQKILIYIISFVILGLAIFQKLQIVIIFVSLFLIFFHFPEMRDIGSILANLGKGLKKVRYGRFSGKLRSPVDEPAIETRTTATTTTPPPEVSSDPIILFSEGNELFRMNMPFSAADKYKQATLIDSNFSDAHLNLGAAYMAIWNQTQDERFRTESMASSGTSLQLAPEGYRSRINLAVALSKDPEEMPRALELYEQADEKGSIEDPLTWGKVKLFKANLILTLSDGLEGEIYQKKLPEAARSVRTSIRLFKMVEDMPETARWIDEAKSTLTSIKAKLRAVRSTTEPD